MFYVFSPLCMQPNIFVNRTVILFPSYATALQIFYTVFIHIQNIFIVFFVFFVFFSVFVKVFQLVFQIIYNIFNLPAASIATWLSQSQDIVQYVIQVSVYIYIFNIFSRFMYIVRLLKVVINSVDFGNRNSKKEQKKVLPSVLFE